MFNDSGEISNRGELQTMKKVKKRVFFIVAVLIFAFTALSFVGISTKYGDRKDVYIKGGNDIRWGIDIRGGVDATFTPPKDVKNVTKEQMDAAKTIIQQRLVGLNITDYEVYADSDKNRIIVRFPWKENETNYDPKEAIAELGQTANLTFREGTDLNGKLILSGKNVTDAKGESIQEQGKARENVVSLKLDSEGAQKFADATATTGGTISIWMDETNISSATVQAHITDGNAQISGNFTLKEAQALAAKIKSGSLPFKLETENYQTISPTLGTGAKDAMILSGIIAFAFVVIFMISVYRLPGFVACIALTGQLGGTIAAITGLFGVFDSFTLTLPGIAGIILGIGMGVDANVIFSERIKEEINSGKSIDGSIDAGFKRGFTAIFDGNMTTIISAVVLMGAFGPTDSFFSQLLRPVFFMFGATTAGAIYSFGYTLLVSVLLNFIMAVTFTRLMTKSLSQFKCFRNPRLYGGAKNEKV